MADHITASSIQLGLAPTVASPLPLAATITMEEKHNNYCVQIAGFEENGAHEGSLSHLIGKLPGVNSFQQTEQMTTLGLSPMTWLVLTNDSEINNALDGLDRTAYAVTDLSAARCLFEIKGEHASFKLSKGALLDFQRSAFGVGELRQTTIHHIACTVLRTEIDCFQIITTRSFADDLKTWLEKP